MTFAGDRMRVRFDSFGAESYATFLRCKRLPESTVEFDPATETYAITAPARFASLVGAEPPARATPPLPLADHLFDYQKALVAQALEAKRFAVWAQCGRGKTLIALEFGRHVVHYTGGRFLIVTVNEAVPQWVEEARRFYGDALPLRRLRSKSEMREWCEHGPPGLAVTNYEKFNPEPGEQVFNECRHVAGVALDENRLKTGGGKQKWVLIKSFKGVEYKLTLTATPAPNDPIEFASQASFLEKMRSESEVIWTFFTRDPKTHRWTVRPHARDAFFEFMASWSVYLDDPRRYGWAADLPEVPKPEYVTIPVEPTDEQREVARVLTADAATGQMDLFGAADTNAIQRTKLSQIAKGFRYRKLAGAGGHPKKGRRIEHVPSRKPGVVAGLVRDEAARGSQVLVWTVFDEESDILSRLLDEKRIGHEVLVGPTKPDDRLEIIDRFRRGETRVLVSRASVLGFGMNFQFVGAMIFSGWNDSFESLYQAVRRAVRFGQRERVRVYFPVVPELEGDTLDNIRRKAAEFERSIAQMEDCYVRARRELLGATAFPGAMSAGAD